MVAVAKRFPKHQLTVRVNPANLSRLQATGERLMRNTSEMVDRAIEHYLATRAQQDIADAGKRLADIRGEHTGK